MNPISEQEEFEFRLRAEQEASGGVTTQPKPDGFRFDPIKAISDVYDPQNMASIISGQAPQQLAGALYEQPKQYLLNKLNAPKKGFGRFLSGIPIDIVSGGVAELGAKGIGKIASSRANMFRGKAEDLVPRLLPPESGTIKNQIYYGGEKDYQKNLAPFIKKSKDYPELAGKLKKSEEELVSKRQGIYNENPQIQDQQMMQPAIKTLKEAEDIGVVPGSKAEQMRKLITEQVDFLNNLPKEKRLSTEFTQRRKQAFQNMAENIYGKAIAPDEKIAQQMYRDFAKANQTALEGLSPEISGINRKIGALIQGRESASNLGEKAATGDVPGIAERLLSGTPFFGNYFALNEAKKAALGAAQRGKSVASKSARIERYMNKAGNYETASESGDLITNLLRQIFGKRETKIK